MKIRSHNEGYKRGRVRRLDIGIEIYGTVSRLLSSLVRYCFLDVARLHWLIPASCAVLLASIWLMLSPGINLFEHYTWGLLSNLDLEGEWQLYTGQVLHVDFHDVLGDLTARRAF